MAHHTDLLKKVPLFAACSEKDLRRLDRAADELDIAAGQALTKQGQLGREVFIILDGSAEVTKDGVHVADLGPGAHVGELSLLDGGPRSATVTTTALTRVLVLTKPAFNGVLDEVPTLAHKLLVSLAHRLREAEESSVD